MNIRLRIRSFLLFLLKLAITSCISSPLLICKELSSDAIIIVDKAKEGAIKGGLRTIILIYSPFPETNYPPIRQFRKII